MSALLAQLRDEAPLALASLALFALALIQIGAAP